MSTNGNSDRIRGRVKWFNAGKGYGFISHPGGRDVFCHHTAIQQEGYRTLDQDQEVEYSIVQGDKGPQADNVVKVTQHVAE